MNPYILDPADEPTPDYSDPSDFSGASEDEDWGGR
jgi:hypothetical protein